MTRKSQKSKHLGKDISYGRNGWCIGSKAETSLKSPVKRRKGGMAEGTVRREDQRAGSRSPRRVTPL